MKTSIANSRSVAGVVRVAALVALLGFLSFAPNSQAQESPAAAEQAPAAAEQAAAPKHKDKTFFQVLREGGIVMIPLAAISVYMLTLIIDSIRRIQNKVVCPPDIVNLPPFAVQPGRLQRRLSDLPLEGLLPDECRPSRTQHAGTRQRSH